MINAYHLRVDDEYNFEGEADEDSICGGARDVSVGITRLLTKMERKNRNLLPGW